jgi:DNA-3-methyladenine glycosylase II
VAELTARDPRLAAIVERHGPPPMFARPPGFATLVWIILEQQVSIASAAAMLARLTAALPGGAVTPAAVAELGPVGLQALGVTRQKSRYVTCLAERILSGEFALDRLALSSDIEAEAMLLDVPGVGRWTAGVYLLMALGRPDVWPPGDLGLHKSMAEVRCLRYVPSSDVAARYALRWRPWRAVAARLLWHSYLSLRRPSR